MRIPFFKNKKSLQSKPTVIAPAPGNSAEVRQLTLEEYAAVSGGPEGEVGDGTVPT